MPRTSQNRTVHHQHNIQLTDVIELKPATIFLSPPPQVGFDMYLAAFQLSPMQLLIHYSSSASITPSIDGRQVGTCEPMNLSLDSLEDFGCSHHPDDFSCLVSIVSILFSCLLALFKRSHQVSTEFPSKSFSSPSCHCQFLFHLYPRFCHFRCVQRQEFNEVHGQVVWKDRGRLRLRQVKRKTEQDFFGNPLFPTFNIQL